MKIFYLTISYDGEETARLREDYKDTLPPKKLRGIRVYRLVDEYERSERYCCVFSPWGFLRLYFRRPAGIGGYWVETLGKWIRKRTRVCVLKRKRQIFFGRHPSEILLDLLRDNGFNAYVFEFIGHSHTEFHLKVEDLAGMRIDPEWIQARSGQKR